MSTQFFPKRNSTSCLSAAVSREVRVGIVPLSQMPRFCTNPPQRTISSSRVFLAKVPIMQAIKARFGKGRLAELG